MEGVGEVTDYDYGYPHPDDVTPEIKALVDADLEMDRKRQADRKRAEQALTKAGWRPLLDGSYFIGNYPGSMARVGFNLRGGSDLTELIIANTEVPALLSPALTDAEREALEYFADGEYHGEPLWDRKAWRVAEEHHQAVLAALLRRLGGDNP